MKQCVTQSNTVASICVFKIVSVQWSFNNTQVHWYRLGSVRWHYFYVVARAVNILQSVAVVEAAL